MPDTIAPPQDPEPALGRDNELSIMRRQIDVARREPKPRLCRDDRHGATAPEQVLESSVALTSMQVEDNSRRKFGR
jgi:hypothetical protein